MRVLSLVCVLFVLLVASAQAGDDVLHLNVDDPMLIALVQRGLEGSETFRELFQRLQHSDVIVHLRLDPRPVGGATGYNQFVTTAGGYRFLRIGLAIREPDNEAVALLGHELQHATELAAEPHVVDVATYARLYEQIGYPACRGTLARCFETQAAISVGRAVRTELRSRHPTARASRNAARDLVLAWLTQLKALANKKRIR